MGKFNCLGITDFGTTFGVSFTQTMKIILNHINTIAMTIFTLEVDFLIALQCRKYERKPIKIRSKHAFCNIISFIYFQSDDVLP